MLTLGSPRVARAGVMSSPEPPFLAAVGGVAAGDGCTPCIRPTPARKPRRRASRSLSSWLCRDLRDAPVLWVQEGQAAREAGSALRPWPRRTRPRSGPAGGGCREGSDGGLRCRRDGPRGGGPRRRAGRAAAAASRRHAETRQAAVAPRRGAVDTVPAPACGGRTGRGARRDALAGGDGALSPSHFSEGERSLGVEGQHPAHRRSIARQPSKLFVERSPASKRLPLTPALSP